jgi:predicted GIY-YIG superfamily endonuclease
VFGVTDGFVYTLRTEDDMAVFYVGKTNKNEKRLVSHYRAGKRKVAQYIRQMESIGRKCVCVVEEYVCPGKLHGTDALALVEQEYIKGYSRLLGEKLQNEKCIVADDQTVLNRKRRGWCLCCKSRMSFFSESLVCFSCLEVLEVETRRRKGRLRSASQQPCPRHLQGCHANGLTSDAGLAVLAEQFS